MLWLLYLGEVIALLGVIFVGGCLAAEIKDSWAPKPRMKKVTWFNGAWKDQ